MDCKDCEHFTRLSDWMCVDYKLIEKDLSITETTLGDENSILKLASHNMGWFGQVYTVCNKHKIILPCSRADICGDYNGRNDQIIIPRYVFDLLPNVFKDRVLIKRIEEHCVTIVCFETYMVNYLQEFTEKANKYRDDVATEGLRLYLLKKHLEGEK